MDERIAVKIDNGIKKIFFQQDTVGISGSDKIHIDDLAQDLNAIVIDPYNVLNDYLDIDYQLRYNSASRDREDNIRDITADYDSVNKYYNRWRKETKGNAKKIANDLYYFTNKVRSTLDSKIYDGSRNYWDGSEEDRIMIIALWEIHDISRSNKFLGVFRNYDKISEIFEPEFRVLKKSGDVDDWRKNMDASPSWWRDRFYKVNQYENAKKEVKRFIINPDMSGTDDIFKLKDKKTNKSISVYKNRHYPRS